MPQVFAMAALRILITGAASGIGAESAKLLRQEGAQITALDRARPEDASAIAQVWHAVDIADAEAIDAVLGSLQGPFDAVLNIAGIPPKSDNAAALLRVNFLGLRRLSEALESRIAPGGAIVNLSSRAGWAWRENADQVRALLDLAGPDAAEGFVAQHNLDPVRAYNLSKEALTVWTFQRTEDLISKGLRMNAVCPAAVDTPILADFASAFGDRVEKLRARLGGAGTPEQIARLVVFLARPDSAWIRGAELPVDGGAAALANCAALDL
ncbi:MAG: coniferyl-alcohol dehydrogenase [Pseudomonadota bacterium]